MHFPVAGAASQLVFTNQPAAGQTIQATGTGSFAISVAVEDAIGNVVTSNVSNVVLAINNNPSSGALSCTGGLAQAASNGIASFTGCAITKAGTGYTLKATQGALTPPTNANAFNIIAGAASKLAFTVQPVGGVIEGASFGTSPAVAVEDTNGNIVASDTSNVTLAVNGYTAGNGGTTQGTVSCSNSGFPTVPAVSGVVAFTNCQIAGPSGAGTYTLVATRSGSLQPVRRT